MAKITYIEHDGAEHVLDVAYTVTVGPRVDIGAIRLSGLGRVQPDYVRRRLLVHSGQEFQPSAIEAARQDLHGTGVRVTLIEPGMVDTPFFDERPADALHGDDIARAVIYAISQRL